MQEGNIIGWVVFLFAAFLILVNYFYKMHKQKKEFEKFKEEIRINSFACVSGMVMKPGETEDQFKDRVRAKLKDSNCQSFKIPR